MYPPKQPGERDDRDDTPPGSPYSYSWPDGAPYAMSSEELEFCGSPSKKTKRAIEQTVHMNPRYVRAKADDFYCVLEITEVVHSTEKAICVTPKGYNTQIWIPNSCFIYCLPTMVKVKSSFLEEKMRGLKRETVKIGTQLERCPYCGKDTGCDCASPGHKPKVTLIPAPPADLAAQIAKAKLKKFVEENR